MTARGRREANRALVAFVAGADRAAPGSDADIAFGELVERWTTTASVGMSGVRPIGFVEVDADDL